MQQIKSLRLAAERARWQANAEMSACRALLRHRKFINSLGKTTEEFWPRPEVSVRRGNKGEGDTLLFSLNSEEEVDAVKGVFENYLELSFTRIEQEKGFGAFGTLVDYQFVAQWIDRKVIVSFYLVERDLK